MDDQLFIIEKQLDQAKTFADIFGKNPNASSIKRIFSQLVKLVHPDSVPEKLKKDADRIFEKLIKCRDGAIEALGQGEYDRGWRTFELTSRRGNYLLEEMPYAVGDHSIIYRGKFNGSDILAKVSKKPVNNPFLEAEAKLLEDRDPPAMFAFVPQIKDSFCIDQKRLRYRVNIMPLLKDFVTLSYIKELYPNGIDPRDAAWMFRRILGCSLTAKSLGLTHTAITMDHILVHPLSHDPLYLGWGHAATQGKFVSDRIDTKMAADIFVDLCNKMPVNLKPLMNRCRGKEENRLSVRETMDEFTNIIRNLWGKTYRPFYLKGDPNG